MNTEDAMCQVKELRDLDGAVTLVVNKDIRKTGVTLDELLLLRALLKSPGYTLTTGEVTAQTFTQKSVTSHRIKVLQQRGFLGRAKSKEDKRRINITLTAKGRRVTEVASGMLAHSFSNRVLPVLRDEQRDALRMLVAKESRPESLRSDS